MSARPTFSVIVPCKNPGPRLQVALASVWTQIGVSVELIVIDGASSDGTREWLQARHDRIATVVSAPDAGVYAAMNQGVAAAQGEWLYFLGADDRLADDHVLHAASTTVGVSEGGVVAGEVAYDDGRVYAFRGRVNPTARNFVHHQAAFYRRQIFAQHGLFDESLEVMGDYDLNLRLWQKGVRFVAIPVRMAICGSGGLSDRGTWRGYREEIAVRHRYFSPERSLPWDAVTVARFVRKHYLRTNAARNHARVRPEN